MSFSWRMRVADVTSLLFKGLNMGKVALVTGGAQRIGRRLVERLAEEGYAVAIHCRHSTDEAQGIAGRIRNAGGKAAVLQADLADGEAVGRLIPEAVRALG